MAMACPFSATCTAARMAFPGTSMTLCAAMPSPPALTGWGLGWATGSGVAEEEAAALRLYRKAVDLGSPSGMYTVGLGDASGSGEPKDGKEGVRWSGKAAAGGDLSGMDW